MALCKISGRITDCEIRDVRGGGLFSEDAAGLEIVHNHVHDCGDNGILVWRLEIGADGTIVMANRVERIPQRMAAAARTAMVSTGSVARITDCAAIRANSGSNLSDDRQLLHEAWRGRSLRRVRLPGAVIANNIVDNAAMGISVTNEGGRLAVTQHLLPHRRA